MREGGQKRVRTRPRPFGREGGREGRRHVRLWRELTREGGQTGERVGGHAGQGGRRDSWDGAHGQENDSLPQRKLRDRGALAGIQSNACIMSLYLAYALAHVSDAVMAFSVWLW